MNKKIGSEEQARKLLKSTIASIAALGMSVCSTPLKASADKIPDPPKFWEKCYGVAKEGMNDCTSRDQRHGCGAKSTIDSDPTEYIWVPYRTCKKIVGGDRVGAFKVRKTPTQCRTTSTSK